MTARTTFCFLGHAQRAMECPACGEAATGQRAKGEHWRWYRNRTSSKRIRAAVDEYLRTSLLATPNPTPALPRNRGKVADVDGPTTDGQKDDA